MLLTRRRGRRRSIQYWLTWLVVGCIVPTAAGAAILLVRSYEYRRIGGTAANAELIHSLWLNAGAAGASLLMGAEIARRIGRHIGRSITALGVPALDLRPGEIAALPASDILEVEALRIVLLNAAHRIKHERDGEFRMAIAAAAAEQTNRAKSAFLRSVIQGLSSPVRGILRSAEMLRLGGDLTAAQTERVRVILEAGEHLLGRIDGVREVSRTEAGPADQQPEAIELTELVRTCLDAVKPAAEKKGLALALAPAEALRVFADRGKLRQVVMELLGTAITFTRSGTVEVRLSPSADRAHVRLEVGDSGPAMPTEHRDHLLRPFNPPDGARLDGVEAAGLGLALSVRLAALMGGRLMHGESPGGGSIVWLELPVGSPGRTSLCGTGMAVPAKLPTMPVTGSDLLVLDEKALELTAAHLTPSAVASCLRTIAERGDDLLRGLNEPDALTRNADTLVEAAHKLAGSAGMFGFQRLSVLAQNFERTAPTDTVEALSLADELSAAIEATLQEIGTRTVFPGARRPDLHASGTLQPGAHA